MNQGGGRGWPAGDEAARLARVEQQLADLQAEVAQLRRVLNRSSDQERGGYLPDTGPAVQVGTDVQAGVGQAEVVLTLVAAKQPRLYYDDVKGELAVRRGPDEVRVHVIVHAPPEFRDWARGQPSPLREDVTRLVDGMRERLSQQAAGRVIDVVWKPATSGWSVVDFGGFNKMAGLPADFDDWGHQQVGTWATQATDAAGLPLLDGAGAVIRYLVPLPFDRALHDASRVIQVAGILAFALPGGHVLACASLKSLVHDEMTDLLAEQLRTVMRGPVPASPGHGEPQPGGPQPSAHSPVSSPSPSAAVDPDLKRLAAEILRERSPGEPAEHEPPAPHDPARPYKQEQEPGSPFNF